jgi:tetratricopeptide (TPR) repeat protein
MDFKTDRFQRIEAIFHEALAVEGDARAQLIDAQCGEDSSLAAQVRLLLSASEKEEQRTTSLASEREQAKASESVGRHIGPYVLDGLLGRGGMGVVYLAHRADGEFEQKVAIKLIDLPLATTTFRERFRQERQILAALQHPYIARLLDGGVTANGDPYLVMEFVDGIPIHRYCERENLTLRQRLKLFLQVVEAVQFAHQNFVVHRDLKPDNILIAADGTPRLLDFGTAKMLSPSFAAAGAGLTLEGYQSFTPQYASPEQVLGSQVTAASDTYSLGVLLYLLLTGSQPYQLNDLSTAELLRVICEEPPSRPAQAEAQNRSLDADLDAILMKALRKEPSARYGTAIELATDIHAWLDGMPVAARRGSFRYKAGKFIHRNRIAVAASALLAASLIAGVIGVVWQANVANQERRKAEESAADLRQLSNSLLSELDEAIKELPGSTGAQKLLVTRVLEHLDRTAKNIHGDRQTQLDLVNAYTQMGEIQGDPYVQNLGDPHAALTSIGKAIDIVTPLAASSSSDRDALRLLALAQQYRGDVLFGMGETDVAVRAMRVSTDVWDKLIAFGNVTPVLLCDAGSAYGTLGDELGQSGTASLEDAAGAIAAYRKALTFDDRVLSIDPHSLRARRGISIYDMKIGSVDMETDPAAAVKEFTAALQNAEALPEAEKSSLSSMRMRATLMRKQAIALEQLGEYAQSVPLFLQAVDFNRRTVAQDTKDSRALFDLVVALDDTALGYEDAADPALAAQPADRRKNLTLARNCLAEATDGLERLLKMDPDHDEWRILLSFMQVRLGAIDFALHTRASSDLKTRMALNSIRELYAKGHLSPQILSQAAESLLRAEPASLEDPQLALACAQREVAQSHAKIPSMLLTLAQAYRATGQIEKCRATAREGLVLLPGQPRGAVKPRIRKLLEIQTRTAR